MMHLMDFILGIMVCRIEAVECPSVDRIRTSATKSGCALEHGSDFECRNCKHGGEKDDSMVPEYFMNHESDGGVV